MNNALGRHIIAEFYNCSEKLLNCIDFVEKTMVNAALACGAEVREFAFHKFSPQGVSGVVIISESHLTIHTWPELGYAAIDVFTCGDTVDPWDACNHLFEHFEATHMDSTELSRGMVGGALQVVKKVANS